MPTQKKLRFKVANLLRKEFGLPFGVSQKVARYLSKEGYNLEALSKDPKVLDIVVIRCNDDLDSLVPEDKYFEWLDGKQSWDWAYDEQLRSDDYLVYKSHRKVTISDYL